MLRNHYHRTDLFAMVPRLGLRFEPQLELLDRLPVAQRKARFIAWLKTQPDGREIWESVWAIRREDLPLERWDPEVN